MKIVQIRTWLLGASASPEASSVVKRLLFVKLATDAGLDGGGEASVLSGRECAVEQIILALAEPLLGKAAVGPRPFRSRAVLGFVDKRTGIDCHCALSALELALWDLAGKSQGAPVHRLLGGALRDRIPLHANTWTDRAPTLETIVERAAKLQQAGFDRSRSTRCSSAASSGPRPACGETRRALGPDLGIMIDLNALDDPHLALQAGRRFEPYEVFWLEEPVTSDDLDTLADIRSRVRLRVVSGERHGLFYNMRSFTLRRGGFATFTSAE